MVLNVYFRILDDTTLPILEELRNYRYKSINYWINPLHLQDHSHIGLIRNFKHIIHNSINKELTCYDWNINECSVIPQMDGVEHLVSRCVSDGADFVCIDNRNHPGNQMVLFQDAVHLEDYPNQFIKIPCFSSFKDLISYAFEHSYFSFSLATDTNFERTKYVEHGEPVYREKRTNYYWYWDNFHNYHYEVFDSKGKHLGEANLDGELDTSKKDKPKTISF